MFTTKKDIKKLKEEVINLKRDLDWAEHRMKVYDVLIRHNCNTLDALLKHLGLEVEETGLRIVKSKKRGE